MKAFMSDARYRAGWARVNRTHGVTAVREARAILAETEPETLDTRHASATGLVSWQSHAILAESLAAFVALDVK